MYVLAANRQEKHGNMLTASIRPSGMFGEGDVQFIPPVLKAYRDGRTKFQLGENDNLFDCTYVENAAHGHILAAEALMRTSSSTPSQPAMPAPEEQHQRVDGEAFFITNDEPVYFWDFPRSVWKCAGDTTSVEQVWKIPVQMGLIMASLGEFIMGCVGKTPNLTRQRVKYTSMTRYFNCRKARDRLGYRPLVPLEVGIQRAVHWVLESERRIKEAKEEEEEKEKGKEGKEG